MRFVQFENFVGRMVTISLNHVVMYQECRDVVDCGCKIRVTNGDWIYVKQTYDKVDEIISCAGLNMEE